MRARRRQDDTSDCLFHLNIYFCLSIYFSRRVRPVAWTNAEVGGRDCSHFDTLLSTANKMVVLKGIPSVLSPELLYALARMGHGDELGMILNHTHAYTHTLAGCNTATGLNHIHVNASVESESDH